MIGNGENFRFFFYFLFFKLQYPWQLSKNSIFFLRVPLNRYSENVSSICTIVQKYTFFKIIYVVYMYT